MNIKVAAFTVSKKRLESARFEVEWSLVRDSPEALRCVRGLDSSSSTKYWLKPGKQVDWGVKHQRFLTNLLHIHYEIK